MTTSLPVTAALPEGLDLERVRHEGFDTAYYAAGSGRPLVLIHGSGPGVSGRANWQGTMLSSLAQEFRMLAPDVVGFGQTRAEPPVPLNHVARVRHLVSFLDAMGLTQVDVVGNSMGGALALAIADRHPDRIRRMVLMGTVGIGFPVGPGLDQVWGYEPSLENMAALIELFTYDADLAGPELVRLRYEASADGDVQERYSAAFAAPRQRHIDEMALSEEQLRAITTPTLLLHGAQDRVIPLEETSLRLVGLLPAADLVVFGRCGHWTQTERAEDFQRQVQLFLA